MYEITYLAWPEIKFLIQQQFEQVKIVSVATLASASEDLET